MQQPQTSGGIRPPQQMPVQQRTQPAPSVFQRQPPQQQFGARSSGGMRPAADLRLAQTQMWLNAVNRESSPMSAKQNSLFTTPTSYGNSSAEDWLRTYG